MKKIPVILSALALSLAITSTAAAVGDVNVNVSANVGVQAQGNATSTAAKAKVNASATSTATTTSEKTKNATSTAAKANGEVNAEMHRSAVASFVKSLQAVANRQGGIGAEVRVIAQSQNDSASTTASAMTKIDNRNSFKTVLIGSDYKSIGQLRSEIVTTQNNIDKLRNLEAKVTTAVDKAELAAQIKVLENSQVQIEAYAKAHESSFSFLGWFTKMFVK